MADHRFSVGQQVTVHGFGGIMVTPGPYKVVRLLPTERDDVQYRVQHLRDLHERVVTEGQMSPFRS